MTLKGLTIKFGITYTVPHQIVTFAIFWEIFENCQLKTPLKSKILPNSPNSI